MGGRKKFSCAPPDLHQGVLLKLLARMDIRLPLVHYI